MLRSRYRYSGVSLVELLIGVAISLVILLGALVAFAHNLNASRQVILEARLSQDLRAISQLISRDLKRAGFSPISVQNILAQPPTPNPHTTITVPTSGGITTLPLSYEFGRIVITETQTGTTEAIETQAAAFTIDNNGVMFVAINGGADQALNDPNTVLITGLSIDPTTTAVPLGQLCASPCTGSNCPAMLIRRFDFILSGRSTADATLVRTVETSVRVRNDQLQGACP